MSYRNIASFPMPPPPPLPMRPPLSMTLPPPPPVISFLHKALLLTFSPLFPLFPYLLMLLHISIPLPLIVGAVFAYSVYDRYLRFRPPEEHLRNLGRWLLAWAVWAVLLLPVLVPLGFYEILLTEDVVKRPFLLNSGRFLWGFMKGVVGAMGGEVRTAPPPIPNAAAPAAIVPAAAQVQVPGQNGAVESPLRKEMRAWWNIFRPFLPFLAAYAILRILFAYFGFDGSPGVGEGGAAGSGAGGGEFVITSDSIFFSVSADLEKIMREAESFADVRYLRPRFRVFADGTRS